MLLLLKYNSPTRPIADAQAQIEALPRLAHQDSGIIESCPEMIVISEETGSPRSGSEYDLAFLVDARPKLPSSRRTSEWIALRAELLGESLAGFQQKNESTDLQLKNFRLPLRRVTISEPIAGSSVRREARDSNAPPSSPEAASPVRRSSNRNRGA